jgi:endonuclease-3
MAAKTDWSKALGPLIKKYKGRKHPLDYQNTYQLLVMVLLSAQSSDKLINAIAPELFRAYPSIESLTRISPDDLYKYISKVSGFRKKAIWILKIAQELKANENIPLTMKGLTALTGIGRKSANVILRESGIKAEGVIVDLHVVRVAPRLGIAKSDDPKIIEKQIMEKIPSSLWAEAGMAISFLGREICRPTDPKHEICPVKLSCEYYAQQIKTKKPALTSKRKPKTK